MNALMISPLFTMMSGHNGGVKGADTILEQDPFGITVTIVSVIVVISALVVLGTLIWLFSKAMIYAARRQSDMSRKSIKSKSAVVPDYEDEHNGEIIAAITLALKLHKEDLHDRESEVITINSVARAYSPWSSKIHGLTNMPR